MSNHALGPLIFDIEGEVLNTEDEKILCNPYVGGLILFSRNFSSVSQLQDLVASIRAIRPDIFIGVDQEGGRVQRFRQGFTRLPSLQQLARASQAERSAVLVDQCAWLMAAELLSVGIDASFTPVVDLDDQYSKVIGDRSFSRNKRIVIDLARRYIQAMEVAGMRATLKHFPGHGAVEADSHVDLPVDDRSFSEIFENDMTPFYELAKEAAAVMPAHILFPSVDSRTVGFSSVWLQDILRQQLGFEGVIFSDDLSMAGASVVGGYPSRVESAIKAGCDAVLLCNSREGVLETLEFFESFQPAVTNCLARMRAKGSFFSIGLDALQGKPEWASAKTAIDEVFDFGG